jgi:hypothetical protein
VGPQFPAWGGAPSLDIWALDPWARPSCCSAHLYFPWSCSDQCARLTKLAFGPDLEMLILFVLALRIASALEEAGDRHFRWSQMYLLNRQILIWIWNLKYDLHFLRAHWSGWQRWYGDHSNKSLVSPAITCFLSSQCHCSISEHSWGYVRYAHKCTLVISILCPPLYSHPPLPHLRCHILAMIFLQSAASGWVLMPKASSVQAHCWTPWCLKIVGAQLFPTACLSPERSHWVHMRLDSVLM